MYKPYSNLIQINLLHNCLPAFYTQVLYLLSQLPKAAAEADHAPDVSALHTRLQFQVSVTAFLVFQDLLWPDLLPVYGKYTALYFCFPQMFISWQRFSNFCHGNQNVIIKILGDPKTETKINFPKLVRGDELVELHRIYCRPKLKAIVTHSLKTSALRILLFSQFSHSGLIVAQSKKSNTQSNTASHTGARSRGSSWIWRL